MRITRKQMKYFKAKQTNLAKKYSYLKKPRYIVKLQLTFKKQRVVLLFNQLIIIGAKSKEDKPGHRQYSKRYQKRCHVPNKAKTVHRNSFVREPKPKSKIQINKATAGGDKVSAPSNAVSSSPAVIQSETIVEKDSTDKMRGLRTPERDEAKSVPATTPEDVNDQIREQLKLLQSGRRSSIPLLTNSGNSTRASSVIGTKTPSCSSTPSYSRHPSHSSLEGDPIRSTDALAGKSAAASASSHNNCNQKPKFIDSLISKLKTQGLNLPASTNDETQSLSAQSSPEKSSTPNHPPPKPLIECESSIDNAIDNDHLSDHSTSSTDGFLGFKEDEAQFERPNIPGMLPTPLVRKSKGVKSAFVSEELDNFMTENALDNNSYTTAPLKKRHDEALMYAEATPPILLCPQLPSDVEKPRTVAEKRQLLERKADIKYLMIENESTVYRELRKRAQRAGPVPNYTLIRNIQQMNIPFTRDCWRATCWLNTPNGRFYYQTIRDNGKEVKLMGGRGNNTVKELVQLKPTSNKKKFSHQECSKTCRLIGNIKINGLDELITETTNHNSESSFTAKKLNTLSDDYAFQKPGPLSLKKLNPIKSSIDVELGPLELYSLPTIQLEVWPKLDRPLPEAVHPYLKLALPHAKITSEWAEFALSTLKQTTPPPSRRKRKRTTTESSVVVDPNRSFTFNIPYTNNQSRILVRKRRQMVPAKLAKLNSINENEKSELSFMKDVDKSDDVAVAVGDMLTGMIDSVALSLCEADMVKDDPDIDYGKVDGQVDSADGKAVGINAADAKKKKEKAGKVVKELKKLNAKIIHGFDDSWTTKKEECRNAFCRYGCICDSLRGAQTYSYHCKEVNCMFQCKCPSSKVNTSTFESAVHNSDIKQYCDRMNASLAKEEKDFTATVVVSEGKTIYVPTWDEKKKRLKKVPKRLSDCVQFESEFVHRDLSETLLHKEETRQRVMKTEKVERAEDEVLMTSRNDIVKSMIHVNVNVERLSVLDNLQPLCMIHGLYKCFCKFRAIDGRRFEFSNSKIDVIEQPVYTKKRQYTFERNKDEPANKYMSVVYGGGDDDLDCSTCRRVRVVDTNHHKIVNRVRLETIRRKIKTIERDHPERKRLLENRIKRCIAMPDVGQLVTMTDSRENKSKISNEEHQTMETNKPSQSMDADASVKDLITIDANAPKYRSRFNNIITKTMQGISQKLKSMTTLPSPVNKAFYYMQWKHFLSHFNADRIYIWEVQLNTKEVLLVVTDKNIMPIISNAMYVINIKAVSTERLHLLPKLMKLGVENEETEKLSVLLFGISNYWRVLGCTHSKNDFMHNPVIATPTPNTNPALASKIASLFTEMVKLTAQNRSKSSTTPSSNICIRKLDISNIDKIQLPIPVIEAHRWYFMLTLANDFTHIFVPAWKQFISHKKIVLAIEHAKETQRTVQWGPSDLSPQLYVSHKSDTKVFFGPMMKNEALNLQLLQQHENKMILREEYQRLTQQKTSANVTVGTWLYMKDDQKMIVGDISLDNQKLRTYPPQSKNVTPMKPSTSTSLGFIRLKPSTATSSNMKVTLLSPKSSEDLLPKCTTSTPIASSSSSSNVPSSELVRQLSLGLRARPAKALNKSNPETGSIKVIDTKLLLSPQFLASASDAPASNNTTESDPSIESTIQAKPITLSFAPNMQSNADWKDVSKGVPIRNRRFTTFASNNKSTLKRILQRPIVNSPSAADKSLTPNVQEETISITKPNPPSIRERRYTTIISNDDKPMIVKNPFHRVRPPMNVKNFELVQNPGNKLTLTPIPVKESSSQLMFNRPVTIKKVDAPDSVTIHRTDRLNPLKHRPLSPSNKQSISRPVASTSLASSSSTSSAPIVVVKPSNFNLNVPTKVSAASIALDGKSVIVKRINQPAPTFRLVPSNIRKVPARKPVKVEPHVIDSDDDESLPKRPAVGSDCTVNGYFISQVQGLGKIMAKKLFANYSLNLPGGSKLFQTLKLCVDYLNKVYLKDKLFAMVPANLVIEWRFVVNDSNHSSYTLHDNTTLRPSMVLTDTELIDLNSNFHSNERFPLELRHHLLVLRLAHACMSNSEARHKSGLDIVRKSEIVINELKAENKLLEDNRRALQIDKDLNILKLNELKKKNVVGLTAASSSGTPKTGQTDEVITIDSDDD